MNVAAIVHRTCLALFVPVALAASACGPHGDAPPPAPIDVEQTPQLDPTAPIQARATTPQRKAAVQYDSTLVTSYNASLLVRNPAADMAELERVLKSVGATLTYSSANANNASANGTVPPQHMDAFTGAMRELAIEVQSENRSSNDIGNEMRRLSRRLASLQEAHEAIEGKARDNGLMSADASSLLHELVIRERQSVEQQLTNYQKQLSGVTFSVSMSRPS